MSTRISSYIDAHVCTWPFEHISFTRRLLTNDYIIYHTILFISLSINLAYLWWSTEWYHTVYYKYKLYLWLFPMKRNRKDSTDTSIVIAINLCKWSRLIKIMVFKACCMKPRIIKFMKILDCESCGGFVKNQWWCFFFNEMAHYSLVTRTSLKTQLTDR